MHSKIVTKPGAIFNIWRDQERIGPSNYHREAQVEILELDLQA
jgi:hypothetical protein